MKTRMYYSEAAQAMSPYSRGQWDSTSRPITQSLRVMFGAVGAFKSPVRSGAQASGSHHLRSVPFGS